MARILVKGGRVWDGERFFFADVLTNDKLIEKIAPNITDDADYVFDAKGKIVSAGLVDIHVHLKGLASDEFGVGAEISSFPFGVTAVNDAGSVQGDRALLDYLSVKNTVFVCASIKQNHANFDAAEKGLSRYGDKAIGIKVYFDKGENVRDIMPIKEVCAYAKSKNLKVMVHCTLSPTPMIDIVNALSKGDILTHVFHGGDNSCLENNFEALKVAKEKGVILDLGLAGNVHTDFSNFKKSVLAGFLPDVISTDITCLSAFRRGGRYGMTMCMSIAKQVGMRDEEIFKRVTSLAAEALDKGSQWGYLKVGRSADLAVFDYTNEPFDLTDKAGNQVKNDLGYKCVLTVLDGQILYTI
ncbi:MAG: amidohydrolase family protein [Clostridia bacterium]|nr:amidohydrolase family protein [Clostridia bacterium]